MIYLLSLTYAHLQSSLICLFPLKNSMMPNTQSSHDSVCLLSRFHNSTILRKYGSSQKGLRSRKKQRKETSLYQSPKHTLTIKQSVCWASKTTKIFKSSVKTINIINFSYDALGVSVPCVLHWVPTILIGVLLLSSCFHENALACIKMLLCRIFSSCRYMLRSISYLDKHSSAMILCMYILVLMMLPCTTASPGQSNTNCGNKNTKMTLAVTAAVAVASKMNVGSQKHTTISCVSKINDNNLVRRNILFKKSEKELEKIFFK